MSDDPLPSLLHAGRLRPEGPPLIRPPRVEIADTLEGAEADLVAHAGLRPPFVVIADERTWEVLGRRVAKALRAREVVLEQPAPALPVARQLAEGVGAAASLVAVGSGTINDLVKQAAADCGVACAVFATAPSMNGWLTPTASLTVDGVKRSLPVPPPAGAFFDLAVLCAAPCRLRRAGIGDALCRPTVEADALLAHRLCGGPFDAPLFELQRAGEAALRAAAVRVVEGEPAAVRLLVEALLRGSLAMLAAGSSAPASQGEHAICHLLEMLVPPPLDAFHGEQVAVATCIMQRLQRHMLASEPAPRLRPVQPPRGELAAVFGAQAGDAEAALTAKGLTDARSVAIWQQRLAQAWPSWRAELSEVLHSGDGLDAVFAAAGVPVRPEQLGIAAAFWRRAVRFAFALRPRFGFLDLAALSGELDGFAASL